MIFRRKKAEQVEEPAEEATESPEGADTDVVDDTDTEASELVVDESDEIVTDELGESDDEDDEDDEDVADEPAEQIDWREDGPFDYEEVDLESDGVERLDLGALILTPWEGMGLQLKVTEGADQAVTAALAFWEQSGLELALLAAPTSGGLADELLEDLTEEAQQAGGSATTETGPFGPELRRVLPAEGPGGEQLFQVSRTWFAEGPRWLLRGTLLGEAGLTEGAEGAAEPFVEFFRNVVVRRGEGPMVPGDIITMTMPTVPQG